MKKTLFGILIVILFLPFVYSEDCICEIYRGDDFQHAARTRVAIDRGQCQGASNAESCSCQCVATCYDENGVLIEGCYFDGVHNLALTAVGKGWHDCGGATEFCNSSSETVSQKGDVGPDDLMNFVVEVVAKDETLEKSQVQCTSALYQTTENEDPRPYHEDAPPGRACCGNHDVLAEGFDDSGLLTQGTIHGEFICSYTADEHKWQWFYARQNEGSIYHVDMGNFDVVSDGAEWIACDASNDGTENFVPFNRDKQVLKLSGTSLNDRFICYVDGSAERIAECQGTDQAMNKNLGAGKIRTTGKTVTVGETLYYCSSNSEWLSDLDLTNPTTCEAAGHQWTGSACCGGENTVDDNYNDMLWEINGQRIPVAIGIDIGGCFQNLKVLNNTRVADGNYIRNPGFTEGTGQVIIDWEERAGSASIQGQSVQFINPPAHITQNISELLQPGREYRLKAKIFNSLDNNPSYIGVYVNGELHQPSLAVSTKNGEFETIEAVFTSPSTNDNLEVRTGVGNYNIDPQHSDTQQEQDPITVTSTGYAFVDDIELKFSKAQMMNLNGLFYGCMIEEGERRKLIDTHNNQDLIPTERNFQDACVVKGDFFCAPDGNWQNSLEGATAPSDRNTPTAVPNDLRNQFEITDSCCPENYCWNGTICIQTESDVTEPISPIVRGDTLYRCIDGDWQKAVLQKTWDGAEIGYCPSETQCLVDTEGNADNNNNIELYGLSQKEIDEMFPGQGIEEGNPQCIESGQFLGDHFCENASWTSRTKTLATQLLDSAIKEGAGNNYALYCDTYQNVLVDYGYESIEDYLRGELASGRTVLQEAKYKCPGSAFPCTNNFCVLQIPSKDKVIFATSLNTEIDDSTYSFLEAIGKDSTLCYQLENTGDDFKRCTVGDYSLWYSDKLNSVIFSDEGVNVDEISAWEQFQQLIRHPIQGMINFFQGQELIAPPNIEQDVSFTESTRDYNRIYLARSGTKAIQGIIEEPEPNMQFLEIGYANFDEDVCQSAQVYAENHPSEIGYTFCSESDITKYVISYQPDVLAAWQHFTSKIRLN